MQRHAYHRMTGMGRVYRGRFKVIPIQADEHLLTAHRLHDCNSR